MTDRRPAFENLPNWPRWLNRLQAAAYLGVSTTTFKKEQRTGLWPAAGRSSGKWQLWDKRLLDIFSNRLSKISTGTEDEENGYDRDPGYIKRRLEAAYGDEAQAKRKRPRSP